MFNYNILISSIVFIFIDFFYLNIMKKYFNKQIQDIQGTPIKMNFFATLICYVFLITGLNYFIIKPKRSVSDAFLFGIIIYGVFETTNWALFTKWSPLTVIMDTLWGGILFALTTKIIKLINKF
jgi:uncharacterized membrane protein